MRRALGANKLIRGRLMAVCLHALLQERLGVRGVLGTLGGQVRLKRTVDELRRRIPTGIQIQRAHERLVNVLKRRVQAARAGTGLGGAEIAKATCVMMEKYEAAIWAFHGLFVSGPNFDIAFGLMHTIEKAAEIAAIALAANGGKKPNQVIEDDQLRQIGKEFGVTLNEEVLNFKSDHDMYC